MQIHNILKCRVLMQLLQPHYFEYWIKNQYLAYYLIDIVLKSKSWYRIALATATCAADLGILADDIIMGCDFSNLNYEIFLFLLVGKTNTEGMQELEMVNQIVVICDTAIVWYCISSPWRTSCVPIYWLISNEWDAIAVVLNYRQWNDPTLFQCLVFCI